MGEQGMGKCVCMWARFNVEARNCFSYACMPVFIYTHTSYIRLLRRNAYIPAAAAAADDACSDQGQQEAMMIVAQTLCAVHDTHTLPSSSPNTLPKPTSVLALI